VPVAPQECRRGQPSQRRGGSTGPNVRRGASHRPIIARRRGGAALQYRPSARTAARRALNS
jgi:hypothetical protein